MGRGNQGVALASLKLISAGRILIGRSCNFLQRRALDA